MDFSAVLWDWCIGFKWFSVCLCTAHVHRYAHNLSFPLWGGGKPSQYATMVNHSALSTLLLLHAGLPGGFVKEREQNLRISHTISLQDASSLRLQRKVVLHSLPSQEGGVHRRKGQSAWKHVGHCSGKRSWGRKAPLVSNCHVGSWRAPAAPSGDLSYPRQQQLLRRRGWALQGFCHYWNKSVKTLAACWGSLRSCKSDGVGEERTACWGL